MDKLLQVDYGVLALTVCNFLLLVFLLKKFAWGPIVGALEKREAQVRADKENARTSSERAAQQRHELETRLAQISDEAAKKMAEAVRLGEAQKEELLRQTQEQCARMVEQAKAQIAAEKDHALSEVRGEISRLSILAAQRLIGGGLSQNQADKAVEDVLKEVRK